MAEKGFERTVQLKCGDKRAKVHARRIRAPKGVADELKKCAGCGSANAPAKKKCWMCDSPLPEAPAPASADEASFWQMKMELGRKVYWNTDDGLDASMKQLFFDLAARDFDQSAFQSWVNREKVRLESAKGAASVAVRHMTETSNFVFIFRVFAALVCAGAIIWMLYVFWTDLRGMEPL